ncbi:YheC/YheD family endospore coat-associated protein [Bacillus sp. B-jedd]|uniref:YheC/YheD family endospore coat-associated protein n=1 Tax=Bacillus sp. B-jedd TaxID=1476857 RepID=UPI0011DD556D|nr:YheC/YheD family protein [Bacillus sp. B-jedd]
MKIKLNDKISETVLVSEDLWEQWELKKGIIYTLSFGNRTFKTSLNKTIKHEKAIGFPKKAAIQLGIPFSKQVQARIDSSTIKLGPLIGILSGNNCIKSGEIAIQNNSKNDAEFVMEMLSSEKFTAHYSFLFSPGDVDWEREVVLGSFRIVDETGKDHWRHYEVPLPDVIYNRMLSRRAEYSEVGQRFYANVKLAKDIKMFNPHYFSKEFIHEVLLNDEEAVKYLPETIFKPKKSDVWKMVERHRTVFLKPKNRAGGWGIFKITKNDERYIVNNERRIDKYKSLRRCFKRADFEQNRKKYMVQQGIKLIEVDGRNADFRVNLNKNNKNEWVVVAKACKAAGKKSTTTHIRLGGTIHNGTEVLIQVFKDRAPAIEKEIEEAVIILAKAVDKSIGGPIGELGIDLGVDQDGKVWLFEINSLPGRSILHEPGMEDAGMLSIHLLYEYSYFLAGFHLNSKQAER